MKTNLCELLGIDHPIIAAPMGPDLTGPDLVAAVSNAGGLGILQAQLCPPPHFRQEIRRVRALTDRPFGVNLILHFAALDPVAVCLEERVPVLSFFWGDPTPYVGRAHAAGVKVFHQVGSCLQELFGPLDAAGDEVGWDAGLRRRLDGGTSSPR